MVLGTNDFKVNSSVVVYPNPTRNMLYIDKPSYLDISKVTVFNPLGQRIHQAVFSTSLDTSPWTAGLFFIQFQTKDGVISKTVLKK